jgi:ABC-type lipoprotein export system ATPase subunit
MPVLSAQDIHKTYYLKSETIPVLKGINLSVDAGRFVVIVGPSGSGKSTLLNILGSLDTPDQGKVTLDSIDLFSHNSADLSRIRNEKIGFVFQFHHLLPEFSALENVALPALVNDRNPTGVIYKKAELLLEQLGLGSKGSRLPEEMSGGERQRVAICRALVNDPRVLFADEPTGNLDDENTNKLISVLVDLKNEGRTIILVTHSLDIAKAGTDMYTLRDGRLFPIKE